MGEINQELRTMFMEETKFNLAKIKKALDVLKKNLEDDAAIKTLLVSTHGLEGDSLLAKEYVLAYLAVKMNYITTKSLHEHNGILSSRTFSELLVYADSLKRAYENLLSNNGNGN